MKFSYKSNAQFCGNLSHHYSALCTLHTRMLEVGVDEFIANDTRN